MNTSEMIEGVECLIVTPESYQNNNQIISIEQCQKKDNKEQKKSKAALVARNLMSLDEVVFSNSDNKKRSASINIKIVEGIRENYKTIEEDSHFGLDEQNPSKKDFQDLQISATYSQENPYHLEDIDNASCQDSEGKIVLQNENIKNNEHINISEKEMQKNIAEEISKKIKLKMRIPQISLGNVKHGYGTKNCDLFNISSPITEIQSDNSQCGQRDIINSQISSKNYPYDSIESIQNDEFTMKFQSNCPIKSPTQIKIKRKTNGIHSPLSSPIQFSNNNQDEGKLLTMKTSVMNQVSALDVSQEYEKSQNKIPTTQEIKQILFVDDKERERETFPINKEAALYCFTEIKSVKNRKVNAFRSKLNLQSHQVTHTVGDEVVENRTFSSNFQLMQEPISIMEMQKNQNYNTAETPIQKNFPYSKNKNTKKMFFKDQIQHEDQLEEQKELENSKADSEVDKKRRFQRSQLRIKVDPQSRNREETETWDEIISSDQTQTEPLIEPKPKQGSSNFEDIYAIINQRPLGEGTSGCVYQCVKENSEDSTIYAVKVMRNVDEEMSKNIFQTFGIQYRLQHESISCVYEVYYNEDSQTLHYVMEYIPFRSLDCLLKDKKRVLKESDSSSIVQKLLKAVMYMEQRGVCHRDLKPENILISEDLSQIRIIDFGISKSFVKSQRVQHITQYFKHKMYTPTGTPSYKAPEIIQGAGYTQLVDMWDVGVITYQLISKGKHPFKCNSQAEQDRKILNQDFDQQDECWKKASSNVKNFIKQLLRMNRYPAFEALRHPWIEQRKIDISDDGNRGVAKLERKQTNDLMTISVPVHFQAKQFTSFNITATSSEQGKRSGNENNSSKVENLSENGQEVNRNKNDYTNEPSASIFQQSEQSSQQQNIENKDKKYINGNTKKKHSIQGFASTQDVVHIVVRAKLNESREKMMKFILKANTIIKNLEEEQLKLEQKQSPGKALKRTHSVEKQLNSPKSPSSMFPTQIDLEGLPLISSGGIGSSNSSEIISNSQLGNLEEGNQLVGQNEPLMQASNHLSLFSKGARNSSKSNNNNQSFGLNNNNTNNNSGIELQQQSQQQQQNIPQSQMLYSSYDFGNMKYSSFATRKASQQVTKQQKNQVQRKLGRRNSTELINSMEKSIIFTKKVIGELEETFGNNQKQEEDNLDEMKPVKNDIQSISGLLLNNISESKNNLKKQEGKTSIFFPQQSNSKLSQKKIFEELKQRTLNEKQGNEIKNEEQNWKIIADNMSIKSDSDEKIKDNSQDSSSSSSSASSSSSDLEHDETQSFDLDKFLVRNPSYEQQKDSQVSNPKLEKSNSAKNEKESLLNLSQASNKPENLNSKTSLFTSESKNIIKNSQGIFQSAPYTNYMNSSKDNIINKSLIDLQIHRELNSLPAIIMKTSGLSSKENSHNAHQGNLVHQSSSSSKTSNHSSSHRRRHRKKSSSKQMQHSQPCGSINGSIQCNSIALKNQSFCSNCSGNSSQNQQNEVKSQEDDKQPKPKLGTIQKKGSLQMSLTDLNDQNLSFIEMNYSKLVSSYCPNSEDLIPINPSIKKSNIQVSINVSQTSSLNFNNISLSGSGNTVRSHQGNNGEVSIGGYTKEKVQQSKFKQKSENNSNSSSNSHFKKGQKAEFDLSESEHVSFGSGDIPLQTSGVINQKQFLEGSALNSSNDANSPKKYQTGLNGDSEHTSNSDNSNNGNNISLPIVDSNVGSTSSLSSSPSKHKNSTNQNVSSFQQFQQSKDNSLNIREEESKKQSDPYTIKAIPQLQMADKKKQTNSSKSPQNKSPSSSTGFKHIPIRTFHTLNQMIDYSTIIEESGETVVSSIAGSKQCSEQYDGTLSTQLKVNQTKSLTQLNQSIDDKNESIHNLQIAQNPSILLHQVSMPLNFQLLKQGEDSDSANECRFASNSPFHRNRGTPVSKKYKSKTPSQKLLKKVPIQELCVQEQLDFFGKMQSSYFGEDQSQFPDISHQDSKNNPPRNDSRDSLLHSQQQHHQVSPSIQFQAQPPILKYRKNSIKHYQENLLSQKQENEERSPSIMQPSTKTNAQQ